MIKADFSELKEKQIKDVLDAKLWQDQLEIMNKAKALQKAIGENQFDDFNEFEKVLKQALKDADASDDMSLDAKEKKQLLDAITWKNPEAEPVIKKASKVANPFYGAFTYRPKNSTDPTSKTKTVEFQTDSDLRDYENVPLNPEVTTTELIESYFAREVQPHVPDAWINSDKTDAIDEEVGIVGFEIPFNRHFYVYEPPRPLAEIDADLDAVSSEIMQLLGEVHS
jgi:type I restriction enzyme M protein